MKKNFQFSIFLPAQSGNFRIRGFTLIETMVAISILALAVAGPMYVAGRSAVYAQIARDQLIASLLAQEGIEYVRKIRDTAYLTAYQAGGPIVSDVAWNEFRGGASVNSILPCIAPAKKCTLDTLQASNLILQEYEGSENVPPLYLNDGIYNQSNAGLPTAFRRTIQAFTTSQDDEPYVNEIRIESTVSWNFHGIPYSVTVSDHLTPWQ